MHDTATTGMASRVGVHIIIVTLRVVIMYQFITLNYPLPVPLSVDRFPCRKSS